MNSREKGKMFQAVSDAYFMATLEDRREAARLLEITKEELVSRAAEGCASVAVEYNDVKGSVMRHVVRCLRSEGFSIDPISRLGDGRYELQLSGWADDAD